MISNAAFVQLMQQINLPSAAAEYDRFALYCTQLQEWNQRMNLTAITDDEGVAEKHFADSLLPLTMVQLPVGASLVDVGSGAGFPGLPMALARPDLRVTFLDSLQKRLTFLAQLTQMLGVPAATLHARAEDAGQDKVCREQFDVATARAVANLNALAEYCLPLVKVGGLFLALHLLRVRGRLFGRLRRGGGLRCGGGKLVLRGVGHFHTAAKQCQAEQQRQKAA